MPRIPVMSIVTAAPNPVWMTFLQDSDVFVAAGQKPANWCFASSNNAAAKASASSLKKQLAAQRAFRVAHLPPKVRAMANKHPDVQLFLTRSAKTADGAKLTALTASTQNTSFNEVLQATQDILVDQNGRWARFTVGMNQDEYNYIMANTLWTKAGQSKMSSVTFPVTPHRRDGV